MRPEIAKNASFNCAIACISKQIFRTKSVCF